PVESAQGHQPVARPRARHRRRHSIEPDRKVQVHLVRGSRGPARLPIATMSALVALARDPRASYPVHAPFDADAEYPELAGRPWAARRSPEPNQVYSLVRACLHNLGLDNERFGTPAWNPLSKLVARGARVVIKPNFVLHERGGQRGQNCLVTHASVLRAL